MGGQVGKRCSQQSLGYLLQEDPSRTPNEGATIPLRNGGRMASGVYDKFDLGTYCILTRMLRGSI